MCPEAFQAQHPKKKQFSSVDDRGLQVATLARRSKLQKLFWVNALYQLTIQPFCTQPNLKNMHQGFCKPTHTHSDIIS